MIGSLPPFVVTNQLDEPPWHDFLCRSDVDANIFHTPQMVRVFASAARHRTQPWAALDGNGRIRSLFIPVEVTLRQGAMRFLTSRSVAYGGIARSVDEVGVDATATLLKAYAENASRATLFTEIRHLTDPVAIRPALAHAGFRHEDHLNYLLALDEPGRDLWRTLHGSARSRVRRAERDGVTVVEVTDPESFEEAYRLLEAVYRRVRVPLASRSLFDSALEELVPRGMLHVFIALLDGTMIAARLVLAHGDRALDWYAGSDRRYSSHSPNELLVWHTLCWAQDQGFSLFDFGGAGRPQEPYGPREFKSKFGGDLVDFGRDILIHAPMRLKLSRAGYSTAQRLRLNGITPGRRTEVAHVR